MKVSPSLPLFTHVTTLVPRLNATAMELSLVILLSPITLEYYKGEKGGFKMMRGNKFVVGLAVGALAGTLTGMLLAPKSGKETRKAIKTRAGELGSRTRQLVSKRRSAA